MKRLLFVALFIFLGLMTTYYYMSAFMHCLPCAEWHRQTIAGEYLNPHQYRVLAPFLVQAIFQPQTDAAIRTAYVLAHAVALPAMLGALYLYWKRWVSDVAALAGVLFIAAYSPLMFAVYGLSLNNPLEIILLCAGLLWLLSGRAGVVFAALVVVGTLNRETALLLPLAYAALHLPEWKRPRVLVQAFSFFALWAVVFGGVRLVIGPVPDQIAVADVWKANTSSPWHMTNALINLGVTVPVWILAALDWKTAPARLKRLALVGLPYLGLLMAFALWNETRLLLPLFALWMPLALRTLERLGRGVAVPAPM